MKKAIFAVLCAGALVVACGGNGDDDEDVTPAATAEVPTSASQSVTGFIEYLKLLVASSADMLEPVDTSLVTGPTDETSEPQPVD